MKHAKAIMLALSLSVLSVPAMAKTNDTTVNNVNVQFKKNTTSATYKGRINGYNYTQYNFKAREGQLLKVTLTSTNNSADKILFSKDLPDSVDLSSSTNLDANGNYVLPHTGSYQIRVLQSRAFARRNQNVNYTLKISIQ